MVGLLLGLAVTAAWAQGGKGEAPSPAAAASGKPSAAASSGPTRTPGEAPPHAGTGGTPLPAAVAASPPPAATTSPAAGGSESSSIVLPPPGDSDMAGAGSAQIHWGRQIAVTLVWLVVVCGGAWLVLRLFYSSGPGLGGFGRRSRKLIHVLDRQVVGQQKVLLLVEVPGKVVLVGLTDQQIRTLAELNPDDLLEGEEPEAAPAAPTVPREVASASEETNGSEEQRLAELFGRRSNDSTTSLGRP